MKLSNGSYSKKTKEFKRTLILNVDRDNDIGRKAQIETPLIGREALLNAANKLLLADPEEADGNAIFAAIKIYDTLKIDDEEEKEVALIAGDERGGPEADRRLIVELNEVLKRYPADNIILVTDGFSDEEIIPVLASRIPITSIHRVVVKHSKSVEETYALLGKYLKMIWTQTPYKFYFLAVPGVIIAIIGILSLLHLTEIAFSFTLLILGFAMMIKGFGIDEYISNLSHAPFSEYVKLATYIGATISLLVGLYLSYLEIAKLPEFSYVMAAPELIWRYGVILSAHFIPSLLLTVFITGFIYVVGFSLYNFIIEEYHKIVRYMIGLEAMLVIYVVGSEACKVIVDPSHGYSILMLYTAIGIITLSLTIILVYILTKIHKRSIENEII